MIIGVCSSAGAPGVTSTALALAAAWGVVTGPDMMVRPPAVLVEADPSGGDLLYRCGGQAETRNLTTFAAACRTGASAGTLAAHTQTLPCGVEAVHGTTTPGQARGVAPFWAAMLHALRASGRDVVLDLGRLDRTSPAWPAAVEIDVLLWVATSTIDGVEHMRHALRETVPALRADTVVVPVIVTPPRRGGDTMAVDAQLAKDTPTLQACQRITYDPRGLTRLETGQTKAAQVRGRLGTSAAHLARFLTQWAAQTAKGARV